MPILNPVQNWTIIPAVQAGQAAAQRVLLVGQSLESGSAGLHQDIGNDNSWDTLFDANSQLASMCREFRRMNQFTTLDCLAVEDASGTAGTAVHTIDGTATERS